MMNFPLQGLRLNSPETDMTEYDDGSFHLDSGTAKGLIFNFGEAQSPEEILRLISEESGEEGGQANGKEQLGPMTLKQIMAHNERQLAKIQAKNLIPDDDNTINALGKSVMAVKKIMKARAKREQKAKIQKEKKKLSKESMDEKITEEKNKEMRKKKAEEDKIVADLKRKTFFFDEMDLHAYDKSSKEIQIDQFSMDSDDRQHIIDRTSAEKFAKDMSRIQVDTIEHQSSNSSRNSSIKQFQEDIPDFLGEHEIENKYAGYNLKSRREELKQIEKDNKNK